MTNRISGAYGLRPNDPTRPRLRLSRLLTGLVPSYPAAADYLSALTGWEMLGNDTAGDCVAVTWANMRRLITASLATENYPSQSQVWEFYQTQNPAFDPNGSPSGDGPGSNADAGMDIQDGLEYLVKTGGPDGVKALAFAAVDLTNPAEVDAAIALFGGLWVGLDVTSANESEFNHGDPWNYVSGSPDEGGHSVLVGGYGPAGKGALGGDQRFITWAEETSFTDSMWRRQITEAWVVVWPELLGSHEFLTGVSLADLAADYTDLTGDPFPVPVPTPPPPTPPPDADPADVALAAVIGPWSTHVRTRSDLVPLKAANLAWLAAKGFTA